MKEPSGWSSKRKFTLAWVVFTFVAVVIGASWHTILFGVQYKSFNFITAQEVIVPVALLSMLLLGFISTYFFSHIYKPQSGTLGAIKTAFMVLLVPRMVVAFAHAAEQDVNGQWLNLILFEFGLYSIMALVWGVVTGKIYK